MKVSKQYYNQINRKVNSYQDLGIVTKNLENFNTKLTEPKTKLPNILETVA